MSEILENNSSAPVATGPQESLIQLTHVIYALYAIGLLTAGIIAVVGVIIAYVKSDDAKGTYLESHMSWLIRTFWWALGWATLTWVFIVATLFIGALIAWIFFGIIWIWFAYRIIKGWLKLSEKRTV